MKRINICICLIGMLFVSCEKIPPADLAKGEYQGHYYVFPNSTSSGQSTESGAGSSKIIRIDDHTVDFIMDIPGIPDTISNVGVYRSGYTGFGFNTVVQGDTLRGGSNEDIYWRYIKADTSISFWGSKL